MKSNDIYYRVVVHILLTAIWNPRTTQLTRILLKLQTSSNGFLPLCDYDPPPPLPFVFGDVNIHANHFHIRNPRCVTSWDFMHRIERWGLEKRVILVSEKWEVLFVTLIISTRLDWLVSIFCLVTNLSFIRRFRWSIQYWMLTISDWLFNFKTCVTFL